MREDDALAESDNMLTLRADSDGEGAVRGQLREDGALYVD
jgi:hypothetical protein